MLSKWSEIALNTTFWSPLWSPNAHIYASTQAMLSTWPSTQVTNFIFSLFCIIIPHCTLHLPKYSGLPKSTSLQASGHLQFELNQSGVLFHPQITTEEINMSQIWNKDSPIHFPGAKGATLKANVALRTLNNVVIPHYTKRNPWKIHSCCNISQLTYQKIHCYCTVIISYPHPLSLIEFWGYTKNTC